MANFRAIQESIRRMYAAQVLIDQEDGNFYFVSILWGLFSFLVVIVMGAITALSLYGIFDAFFTFGKISLIEGPNGKRNFLYLCSLGIIAFLLILSPKLNFAEIVKKREQDITDEERKELRKKAMKMVFISLLFGFGALVLMGVIMSLTP